MMKKLLLALSLAPFLLSAQSPSVAELKAQIDALVKQIQALQAQKAGLAVPTSGVVALTSDLGVGSSGSQVVTLQQFLISKGFLVMPPGVATGYYGNLTALAVKKFQATYAISSTGFVGPLTRAKLNSLRGAVGSSTSTLSGGLVYNVNTVGGASGGGGGGGRSRSISIPSPTNPSYPAPRVTLVSNTYNIVVGGSATLSWTTGDASACTASGAWSGSRNTGGNENVSPTQTSTYTLTCTGPGGSAVQSVTIAVSSVVSTDTTAPTMSNGSPSGTLSAGTTQANLTLSTNESATCRVSQADQIYGLMGTQFTTTGGTSHSYTVTGLSNSTSYTYYVRCSDASSNQNTSSLVISFSVAAGAVSDTTAPAAIITAPTANQSLTTGTTSTMMYVTTNENATCRFNSTDVAYSSMVNTFSTTGGTLHYTALTGLSNGTSYTRYVRCIDTAGNAMTTSSSVTFSVASGSTGGGGGGGSQTGAPYTPVFFSDWRTTTGTSANAVGDGGKWSILGNTNDVVVNSGLGLPIFVSNVLRVPGLTGGITRKTGMTQMTVGTPRNYRLYFRNDMAYPTSDTQTHPFQDSNAGGQISWEITFHNTVSSSQIGIGLQFATQSTGSITYWTGPNLNKNTWYLLDWQVVYVTPTTLNFYVRISDVNGNVLYDSDDFTGGGYGGYAAMSLATFNNSYTFVANSSGGITLSDGLNVGSNDQFADFGTNYGYQAAVAVADGLPVGTFIGPYGNITGENTSNPTPSDTTAPTVTITAPTANQSLTTGTTSTMMYVTTNENATCRFNSTDVAYSSMVNTFSTTGGTLHYTALTGLSNGTSYTRYVRCIDSSSNANSSSQSVTFSVASASTGGGGGGTGSFANEPSNFTLFGEWNNESSIVDSGTGAPTGTWIRDGATTWGNKSLVSSGYTGSPSIGGQNVIQTFYAGGTAGGYDPQRMELHGLATGKREMFFGAEFQIASNYPTSSSSGGGKQFIIWFTGGGRYILNFDVGLAAGNWSIYRDSTSTYNSSVPVAYGRWVKVEWYLNRGTGAADGSMRVWIDGTLAIDQSGITFPTGDFDYMVDDGANNGNRPYTGVSPETRIIASQYPGAPVDAYRWTSALKVSLSSQ